MHMNKLASLRENLKMEIIKYDWLGCTAAHINSHLINKRCLNDVFPLISIHYFACAHTRMHAHTQFTMQVIRNETLVYVKRNIRVKDMDKSLKIVKDYSSGGQG